MLFRFVFLAGPIIACAALILLFIPTLRLRRAPACALGALFLLLSQILTFHRLAGGNPYSPNLPMRVLHTTGFLYSSFMLLFCGVCVWRFARLLIPALRGVKASRLAAGLLAAGALALGGHGMWQGIRIPDVRQMTVEVDDLPFGFDGVRMVHLSDLHCSAAARYDHIRGIVERANALKPDLICITGDFVDGSPAERAADLSPLKDLHAGLGVFGCAGNHEYYSGYRMWRSLLASYGVIMLDNTCRILTNKTDRLVIGGVTDRTAERYGEAPPDIRSAFANAPAGLCRILLQHRPVDLPLNAAAGVRLQLSGHTHGGAVPGFSPLVAYENDGHVRGLYRENRILLHVSPGTGQWSGFPIRIACPAEITELTLRRRSPES